MIKVRDGYGKLIGSDYNGNIAHVLLSNGGNLQYAVGSTASTLVQRNASGQIESSVASTVAPFVISSTKVNANLNADLLDGFQATGLFQSLTSATDKNLYIKIGDTEKEISPLYASYLGGVTKEGLFTELTNVNDSTNPDSIKVTIGDTTKYLKVAYSDLAGKVVCSSSTNDVDRPIIVTNTSNGVYYSTKVTLNYSTGNVTAPTFTGTLIGNADTATTASKLSTVSKTAWGQTYLNASGVPQSISGNMTDVGSINMSGDILISSNGETGLRQVQLKCGTNDYGRVAVGVTAINTGWMEIATADDGLKPIYVRQYTGVYSSVKNEAILLDASGNTYLPGYLETRVLGSNPSTGKAISDITSVKNDANIWNKFSNVNLYLKNANNALAILVGGTENERQALIQVGHSETNYGNSLGTLHLNKLGGNVYINNTLAATVNSIVSGIKVHDIRGTAPTPDDFPDKSIKAWFNTTDTPSTAWFSGFTVKGWTDEYRVWQLASQSSVGNQEKNLYFRTGEETTWNSWRTVLDSGNYKDIIGAGSYFKVNAQTTAGDGDIYLELWRGGNASWKMLNTSGFLKFQCNYTTSAGSYYDVLRLYYLTGDAWIKGALFCASLNIHNTDQINGTHSGIALNYNCEKIVNTSIYNGIGSHIATFYGNSKQTRLFGNLLIGNDPNKNYIAFYGTTGDNAGGFNNTYIGENLWGTPESSELVLFKGSDFGSSATTATNSGPDRIRHIAGAHLFQVFPSALNGTFEAVCASTTPMNILAINSGNIVAFKELLPASDVVLNLGSTGYRWNEVYAKNFTASGAFIGNLTGYAGYIGVFDTRNDTITPETYSLGFRAHFQATGTNDMSDGGSYYGLIHFRPWPHTSGGYPYQLAFTENHNLWFRKAISSTTWGRWQKIITSYNYNLFAPKLDGTGASGTWNINISGTASKAASLSGGSSPGWGTLQASKGYTNVCTWNTSASSSISFSEKDGQMSLQVDGFFYQNEGMYQVLDTNNAKESVGEFGYVMRKYTIDASALDENTWYPVTIPVSSYTTRIECIVHIDSGTKPSWSTHRSGFSVRKIWEVNGHGWGTALINRLVYVSDFYHASTDPVRGIGQLGNNSIEYVYVRGGGKYFFYTSHNKVPILRTSTYTVINQSVSPTTTTPATIRPNVDVYQQGYNTSSSISNLPINKQSVICTISASGTLGLQDMIPEGRELHVIIKNTSSSAITITIPSTMINVMGENLKIDGNSYGELNILSCGSYYVRGVS